MNPLLQKIDEHYKKVEYGLLLVSGVLVFMIMILVTINVVMRTFFNHPVNGTYEIVVNLFIALVAVGFSYVQGQRGNIIVEIATDNLPKPFIRALDSLGCLIGVFVIGLIFWQSSLNAWSSFIHQDYQTNSILQLPLWPSKLFISIGMLLLFIRLCLDVFLILFNVPIKGTIDESENAI